MSIQRTSLENYVLLLDLVLKMKHTNFKPKKFIKIIRPFCKTDYPSSKTIYFRVRNANLGICLQINKDSFVVSQSGNVHEFIFYCDTSQTSCKTFLLKLLKHNLLTP